MFMYYNNDVKFTVPIYLEKLIMLNYNYYK